MTSLKAGVGVLLLLLSSLPLLAHSETSENLIDNNNWNGATYGADPGGCCASISGSGALYDTTTNTIMFSYGSDILNQTIAINQALQQSGVEVDGYNYGWTWRTISNNGNGGDTLQFEVTVKDAAGNEVERYVYDYSSPDHTMDTWYTESGTEIFKQSYLDPQSIALKIIGKDGGFWAGYYGPEVKDVSLTLNYSANPCAADPLYDPSCSGYAEALAQQLYDQNCSANPLYDSGCPGYAQAYFNQQCTADPLYNASCPGYASAYFSYQCSLDPLFDAACPGYADALYAYECSADPLYDTGCPGYAQAYLDQQCGLDPLYDQTCDGYAVAYNDYQCSLDPLYDSGCPGYEQAYYDQQCSVNPLYDTGCPNYATAYYDYQCSLDALYDTGCNGYADAFYSYQCSLDALYDTQCPGYAQAYFNYQCTLDPLYDRSCDGYNEAYAQENIFNEETTSTETTVSTTQTEAVPVTDPEEIGMPSTTGDSTIDSILNDLSDSQPVTIVVAEPPVDVAPEPNQEETQQEEQVEEELASLEVEIDQAETESDESISESDGDNSESSDESEGETADGGDSEPSEEDKKKSKREKLKKAIAAKAANLANDMSAAASLEAQQAVQQQVLALINYVPGFNTYQRQMNGGYLPDAAGYPETRVPESRRGLRNGLAQQLLHEQMVEMQYENSSSR